MKIQAISQLRWNTATATANLPQDLSMLGEHLDACQRSHRYWSSVQYRARQFHGFVASRFVTTLVFGALLIGLADWLF
jgi:hypothetical protein